MITRAIARRIGVTSAVFILVSSVLSIWGAIRSTTSGLLGPFGAVTDTLFAIGIVLMATSTVLFLKLGHDHEA